MPRSADSLPSLVPKPAPPPPREVRISDRIRLIRNVLPLLIALVVVGVEFIIRLLPNRNAELWGHLIFYGLLGPAVTFFSAEWIAEGTRARERAERELRELYTQLSVSHTRLAGMQELMRDLAEAPDLAAVTEVAARGAVHVTGATHATLAVPGGLSASARGDTLLAAPSADLHAIETNIPGGGLLTLHFELPPTQETRELTQALAAEIGNGLGAAHNRMLDIMTLYSVDQSIRAERNMRRLLSRVTRNMATRLNVDSRAAYLSDQDGVLRLEYAQDRSGEVSGGSPAPTFALKVAAAGTPIFATPHEAAEVFRSARSALGIPMKDEEGLIGVLVLGDARPDAFAETRVPLMALMAGQASLAVRNARAYLYSEELAISDERARIAREIHDGVAQSLAFAAIKLDIVARQLRTNPDQAEEEVKAASALLREQIKEVRRSIFALRPIDLERYGLLETVRRYVADFGEQNGVKTALNVTGDIQLSPGDEAVAFRILQESLNNVAKHARAREVSVSIHGGEWVTLRVQDDGLGFDPAQVSGRISSAGGLGLVQMGERLEARGGTYRVMSSPGHGTLVEAELRQT